MRLILASASPRRAELLTAAGFTFDVCVTDVDEQARTGESPREYVRRLASEKSARALELIRRDSSGAAKAAHYDFSRSAETAPHDDCVVIGADTAVIVDDEILGKPADAADAERMLRRIAGRSHVVMTGVSLRSSQAELNEVTETVVYVDPLSAEEIRWYVASAEGQDKAGAYAIQGLASRFIPRIDGSYSNVVGLPVGTVYRLVARVSGAGSSAAKAAHYDSGREYLDFERGNYQDLESCSPCIGQVVELF